MIPQDMQLCKGYMRKWQSVHACVRKRLGEKERERERERDRERQSWREVRRNLIDRVCMRQEGVEASETNSECIKNENSNLKFVHNSIPKMFRKMCNQSYLRRKIILLL